MSGFQVFMKKNKNLHKDCHEGTEFCALSSAPSVRDFLDNTFSVSKNLIKEYFPKHFLQLPVKRGMILFLPFNFINSGEIYPVYHGDPIEIIFENEQFMVFNKNPNQFIHPLTYLEQNNCLAFFREKWPHLLNVNKGYLDRGLLYRLDYETSGVSVFIKDDFLYTYMRTHFKEVAQKKTYLCWVSGKPKVTGVQKHFFSKSEIKGQRVVVSLDHKKGLEGELSFKILSYEGNLNQSLLEVELKTGLRHQIRAQLAFIGHPIVGDIFYGGKAANRLYLHALSYEVLVLGKLWKFTSNPCSFNGL